MQGDFRNGSSWLFASIDQWLGFDATLGLVVASAMNWALLREIDIIARAQERARSQSSLSAGRDFLVGQLTPGDPHGLDTTGVEVLCDLAERSCRIGIFHPVRRHAFTPYLHFVPQHHDDLAILDVDHSSSQRVSIFPDGSVKQHASSYRTGVPSSSAYDVSERPGHSRQTTTL
jgi:hypothetical protein